MPASSVRAIKRWSTVLLVVLAAPTTVSCADSGGGEARRATASQPTEPVAIAAPLRVERSIVRAGEPLRASVRLRNASAQRIRLREVEIRATTGDRAPVSFSPTLADVALAPGDELGLDATRTFAEGDGLGAWSARLRWKGDDGEWHDGPRAGFRVVLAADAAGCAPTRVDGELAEMIDVIVEASTSAAADGSDVVPMPNAPLRDAFAETVIATLEGDDLAACALPPPYRSLELVDPHAGVVRVVAEWAPGVGRAVPRLFWGTYARLVVPFGTTRAVAIEAPHPRTDERTPRQAAELFAAARGEWLLVAGAGRCANSAESGCDGVTRLCGAQGLRAFRETDAAHSTRLPFFAVHARLSQRDAELGFLQLHGNSDPACPGDDLRTGAVVSDASGTWHDDGPAAAFAEALRGRIVDVDRCGRDARCDACGERNVEARATAGSPDACTGDAGARAGRFVHVEQSRALRGASHLWKLVLATEAAFAPRRRVSDLPAALGSDR